MKLPYFLICTAIMTVALLLGPAARGETMVELPVGATRVLTVTAPITRIVVARPGIVETTVLNDKAVQLVGLGAGRTSLTLFNAASDHGDQYAVRVGDGAPLPAAPAAHGGVHKRKADRNRILHASPDLRKVEIVDGVLSGSVPSLEAHGRAEMVARSEGVETDLTQVAGNQMVAVEIHFAAVAVSTMKELGFNFSSLGHGIQGAVIAPASVAGFSMSQNTSLSLATSLPIQNAFSLFLSSPQSNALGLVSVLSSAGLTQLLAKPTLLARSGEHASFLAGGEIPIPVPQNGNAGSTSVTIDYHPYGVRLDIQPVILSSRRILLRVAPEVSEIDMANAVTFQGFTVPAFRRRSTSTTIELADGQSYMLAGLIYNNDAFTESKVPYLGDIPILGNFFKLTQNARQRQELIVVATPHLVGPMQGVARSELPGAATANYDPSFGDLLLNAQPLGRVVRDYGVAR